jgi:hypothetical protein
MMVLGAMWEASPPPSAAPGSSALLLFPLDTRARVEY